MAGNDHKKLVKKEIVNVISFLSVLNVSRKKGYVEKEKNQFKRFRNHLRETGDYNALDKHGNSLLYHSIRLNLDYVTAYLLKHGADPNVGGRSCLSEALRTPNFEIAELLISNGADVNFQNSTGKSILTLACLVGSTKVVRFLLEHGAYPNLVDNDGRSPLSYAAQRNYFKIVLILLNYHADPNSSDVDGENPLSYAAYRQHYESVKILLEFGADPNIKVGLGETPLIHVLEKPHPKKELIDLFLDFGSKVDLDDARWNISVEAREHVLNYLGNFSLKKFCLRTMKSNDLSKDNLPNSFF